MSHKHGKKKERNYGVAATVTLGASVAAGVAMSGSASAATASEWDRVAFCESSGNWQDPNGGGLQIEGPTWADFGGLAFAPSPEQATKVQQITVAERILTSGWNGNSPQGGGAWAVNVRYTGDTSQGSCVGVLSHTPYSAGNTVPPVTVPPTSTPSGTTPAVGSKAYLAVQYAKAHISSAQYLWGGNGPVRFDCSGLTSQAWKAAGVDLPNIARDSYAQEAGGWAGSSKQTLSTIRPGDLVAYNGFSGGHVALYVGPIGPNGENLIETNSRHPGSGVNWSFMDSRSGRPTSAITGITRPAPFVAASGGGTTAPPSGNSGGAYVVKSGDTLSGIATSQKVVGGWQPLYAANKTVIGPNPNLIFPGQKLTLPGGVVTVPGQTPPPVVTPPPAASGWGKPLASYVKGSGFGATGGPWSLGFHTGLDLIAPSGTPIKSVGPGVVVSDSAGGAYGTHVVIKHSDGTYALYAHMSAKSALGAVGSTVKGGDLIGYVGTTGNTNGPHLHLEARNDPSAFNAGVFKDPAVWLSGHGVTL